MRSLNDFKANIQNLGTVKQNRFEVFFHRTAGSWSSAPKDLTFRCESLNIPGSQILTSDFKLYGGQPITKIPNGRAVDEVQMTFLTTADMRDKYWFDEWVDQIADHTSNTLAYYNDVASDITIGVFNESNVKEVVTSRFNDDPPTSTVRLGRTDVKPIYSIKMVKAIPTRVEAMQVSWADVDQLLKYTVNFSCETLQFLKNSNTTSNQYKHLDKV